MRAIINDYVPDQPLDPPNSYLKWDDGFNMTEEEQREAEEYQQQLQSDLQRRNLK